MDKVITTALMISVSMVLALLLFNIAYPAILKGGDAINSMANRADERMKTQIAIIHATAELDSSGNWRDINGNNEFEVYLWVKNIGTTRITAPESTDVFLGPDGNFMRIPFQSAAGGMYPYWTGQVENGTDWSPTATLKIVVHYSAPLPSGRYFSKVTVPVGASSDYFWGM